ncbi:MAG: hypothetical protein ACKO1G_20095, partial [Microcystis aeruginosa]
LCVSVVRSTSSPAGLYLRIHFIHQTQESHTTIILKLIDNTIAATFSLFNIAVFEANFTDSVTCFWDLIAAALAYLNVIN